MSRNDDKYLKKLRSRYRKAKRKERTSIPDEFVKTTCYHRKYAAVLLNGKRERVQGAIRRPRRRVYGVEEAAAVMLLSTLFDNICSKLLRAAMDTELPRLYEAGVIQGSPERYHKLLRVSPSTMDRLRAERSSPKRRTRGFTKPGTLLKDRIPVRTWATGPKTGLGSARWTWLTTVVDSPSAAPIMLGLSALQTSIRPGWNVWPSATRLKCTFSRRSNWRASGCPSHCQVLIPTTAPNSSTISPTATATKRRSPSPVAGLGARTITPVLDRRTGPSREAGPSPPVLSDDLGNILS